MRQAGPGARAILAVTPAPGLPADVISLVTIAPPDDELTGEPIVLVLSAQRGHLASLPERPAAPPPPLDLHFTYNPRTDHPRAAAKPTSWDLLPGDRSSGRATAASTQHAVTARPLSWSNASSDTLETLVGTPDVTRQAALAASTNASSVTLADSPTVPRQAAAPASTNGASDTSVTLVDTRNGDAGKPLSRASTTAQRHLGDGRRRPARPGEPGRTREDTPVARAAVPVAGVAPARHGHVRAVGVASRRLTGQSQAH